MAKRYTLPRGPFVHDGKQITLENVDKMVRDLPRSALADYMAAGAGGAWIAEVPAELDRAMEAAVANPNAPLEETQVVKEITVHEETGALPDVEVHEEPIAGLAAEVESKRARGKRGRG
jgi:hypothetical protein